MISRVTIDDVAAEAGCHRSTVSRAFSASSTLNSETRDRILRIASERGYSASALARAVATRASTMVPLIVPDVSNPFFAALARGAEAAGRAHGYHIVLCDSAGDFELESDYIRSMQSLLAPFALLCPLGEESVASVEVAASAPVVLVAAGSLELGLPTVDVDNARGMQLAVQHLADLGHEHVAFFTGTTGNLRARERLSGFDAAMAGLEMIASALPAGPDAECAGAAAQAFAKMDHRPTALVAVNDLTAIGLVAALQRRGVRVPDDVSVVGFDGLDIGRRLFPRLTSVEQPIGELGRSAIEVAVQILEKTGEEEVGVCLDVRLYVGETTAPPENSK